MRPFRAIDVELVRIAEYKIPKDRPLKNKSVSDSFSSFGDNMNLEVVADDVDLPF